MGGLDGLVNNAGGLGVPIKEAGENPLAVSTFDGAYNLNVRPAIIAINAALPSLLLSRVFFLF